MPNNGNIRIEMEVRAGQTIPSPVDNTLSIPGMAADAKATGDRLQEIESDFQATVQTVAEATATVQAYTEDIEANAAAIQANAGGIAANRAAIQENAAAIEENKAAIQEIIDSGAGGLADTVAENTAAIQANAESIAANAQEITEAQEAIGGKLDKPTNDSQPGMNGWTLTHKSDGSTQWSSYGLPGTDQVESALADWLADHPDAVTSVYDGSISKAKLNSDLQGKTDLVSDSIAPAYEDLLFPVPAGSYCRHNSVLYVAVVDIATSEEWTDGHWAVATIGDALFSLPAKTDKSTIAPEYNALTFPVSAGEFCWHEGTLYRAKQDIQSAESWTAAHWEAKSVSDAIKEDGCRIKAAIASTEDSTTASVAHPAGSYFMLSGVLYQATADIASGAAIVASGTGANCNAVPDGLSGEVSELKSALNNGRLLSDEIINALLICIENLAWSTPNGQDYYGALEAALNPPANLASISVSYTQTMIVYDNDSLSVLRPDLTVTAHYSDSSSSVLYGYLLSGTLTPGSSTVTVTYGGKTDTFNVTVSLSYIAPGMTYAITDVDDWKLDKTVSFLASNNGKTYDEMVHDGTGRYPVSILLPVARNGITIKWNSSAYEIAPAFYTTSGGWKYNAFNNNGFLTSSPSVYTSSNISTEGVGYVAIMMHRKDNAITTSADCAAANIQVEVAV